MTQILDPAKLAAFCPAAEAYAPALEQACESAFIVTPRRVCMFMAQTAHESAGYTVTVENLDYSAQALRDIWPRLFLNGSADAYARQPEKIANRIYADRMGNGDEASGDGWRYRGRGLIQSTGRDRYARFAHVTGDDALADPELLATSPGAALSASIFWVDFKLNQAADAADVASATRIINGGLNGLASRQAWYAKARQIWPDAA